MTAAGPADPDVRDAAATLIEAVGRTAQDARRYRALGPTLADPIFDRILAIGSEIRRAARGGRSQPIADAVEEMRRLLRRCEEGIRDVRESGAYRELVGVFTTGAVARATELAAVVFTDVTAEVPKRPLLWTVPIAARGSPEHFIPPDRCAEAIRALAATGLPVPTDTPEMGGDASIRPLRFGGAIDPSDGPITLAYATESVPGPIGRLAESDAALWYSATLRAPFTVRAASRVSDEWWQVRPAAYASYLEVLGRELATAKIPFEVAAVSSDD